MKKRSVLGHILILSALLAGLHLFALKFSIYWTVGWSDNLMHLFGAGVGSLIVLYALEVVGISPKKLRWKAFLLAFVILSVFSVGVAWELWEVYIGFTDPFVPAQQVDTIWDLALDIIGAIIGFAYYEKRLRTTA